MEERIWKPALNDNESHYLNGFTIAAFVRIFCEQREIPR